MVKDFKVFIISGKARAGKDTTASYIKDYYESKGKKVVTLAFADYIKMYAKKISDWDGNEENKPRSLLQELGTDIIRKKIDEKFFINRIIDDIKVYSYFFDYMIITDARLVDEITMIKNTFSNVVSIHIERQSANELTNEQKSHITETGLDNYNDYDIVINNEGTLEDLRNSVITIMEGLK